MLKDSRDIIPPGKRWLRILKRLAKVVAGLLLFLLVLILLLHVAATQRWITREVTSYLSSKLHSKVEIGSIRFSILGDVAIDDLKVWDQDSNQLISVGRFEAVSSLLQLLKGQYVFDKISLADVDAHLSQREDGMNIRFFLEAFVSKEDRKPDSKAIKLEFKEVKLRNIDFEFISEVSGMSIVTAFDSLLIEGASYASDLNMITGENVVLHHADINILSSELEEEITTTDSTAGGFQLSPDFGLGIGVEVGRLSITDSDFAFHTGKVTETPKFDASHITVKDIDIACSDFLMRADTLGGVFDSLSASMPGFVLDDATAGIYLNKNHLALSGLHFVSGTNELRADVSGGYDAKAIETGFMTDLNIAATGRINPNDFAYFFTDDQMKYVDDWGAASLDIDGSYRDRTGNIKVLKIATANSHLEASGLVNELWDNAKLNWQNLNINASIGDDFKRAISPFLSDIQLPPNVSLQLNSSGSLGRIALNGKANSTWGNATVSGVVIPLARDYRIEMKVTGENVSTGHWVDLPWLGTINLSADASGLVGDHQDLDIKGLVQSVVIMDQSIHGIAFDGELFTDSLRTSIVISDPEYRTSGAVEVSYAGPVKVNAAIQLDTFNAGKLLKLDSTLFISGKYEGQLSYEEAAISGIIAGRQILVMRQTHEYVLDTMSLAALISNAESRIAYFADDASVDLDANFDLRDSLDIVQAWLENLLTPGDSPDTFAGNRTLAFDLQMHKPDILNLIGIPVDALSNLSMVGEFDQQARTAELHINAKEFEGYGMQLDSMYADFTASQDSFTANGDATELFYNAFQLGHLEAEMHSTGDTATTHLLLSKDNDRTLDLSLRFMPIAQGVYVYPDKMTFAGREYSFGRNNPVFISDTNVVMDNFLITHDEMEISVDGDLHALDVSIQNMDLTNLNSLLFGDSIVINKGMLNGRFAYKEDQKLDMHAAIDSLSLYHSDPLAITLDAEKAGDQVPFKFLLTNTSNKVDIDGRYSLEREDIDATVLMDINNLAMFRFLTSGTIDEMHGNIKGEAKVHGPVMKPEFKGFVQFKDVGFTTADPSLDFNIEDETITLDTSGVALKDFTIYDEGHYPLVINGKMKTKDFQSYSYDLNVQTDHYTLMNSPVSSTDQLKGLLVLAADMQLKGNEKDTYVKANITVRDTSSLVYVVANDEVDLLRTEGIVEFVDPGRFADTTAMDTSASFYDSLVAGLPDFNLNSTITIEKQANLRVITDEQSGDYFEASGGAKLDVGYDRSRNLRITGNYTITNGVYRLSFYNLVKKNFTLVPGSSIDWTGSPENGELNIKALHTVASNSIGLIGHEIGENEQSIYKRSLDYEVGINIKGTIEKPVVSFTLDLPKEEKTNYPVLANKLDRLKLPEFQSELNKQVFGLLVLGGFIPESSLADINENVVAATALTNSVNALLAGQLNRFAGQHIKGVNIDVGLQSYSDYSTPGGKTRTAMDFRVSKSILNDRLSFEIGGDFDINSDQSGANTGDNNYRGDMAIIYDLTGNGDKQLKLFNNETYDIIYQEVRNTGISLIFIREFNKGDKPKRKSK